MHFDSFRLTKICTFSVESLSVHSKKGTKNDIPTSKTLFQNSMGLGLTSIVFK